MPPRPRGCGRLCRVYGGDRALLARLRRHPAGDRPSGSPPRSRWWSRYCAAATLLPAMLGALGPHINILRVQFGKTHPDDHQPHGWPAGHGASPIVPWRSAIGSLTILIVLAMPIFKLELGQNDISALPKSTTARQSYDGAEQGFRSRRQRAVADRLRIQDSARSKGRITALQKRSAAAPDVAAVIESTHSRQAGDRRGLYGDLEICSRGPTRRSLSSRDLRDTAIPRALKGSSAKAYVGGQTAGYIDLGDTDR